MPIVEAFGFPFDLTIDLLAARARVLRRAAPGQPPKLSGLALLRAKMSGQVR